MRGFIVSIFGWDSLESSNVNVNVKCKCKFIFHLFKIMNRRENRPKCSAVCRRTRKECRFFATGFKSVDGVYLPVCGHHSDSRRPSRRGFVVPPVEAASLNEVPVQSAAFDGVPVQPAPSYETPAGKCTSHRLIARAISNL